MKTTYYGAKGIVVHLADYRDSNDNSVDPLANVEAHKQMSEKTSTGQFYFSCNQNISNPNDIDYLITYCRGAECGKFYFFVAKVDEIICQDNAFLPSDASTYCPPLWASLPEKTWLKLSNFRLFVDEESFSDLIVWHDSRECDFLTRIKTIQRLTRCNVSGELYVMEE